jgi:hypothetical protein
MFASIRFFEVYLPYIGGPLEEREIARALERRYDGPIPPVAAISADCAMPWAVQLRNRRAWAWAEVRRIGRLTARANRAFRKSGDKSAYRDWTRMRRELAFAVRSWACYRDWTRSVTEPE